MNSTPPLVFLTAGEPSGDLLGGRLMARLREKTEGRIAFAGVGGPEMIAQGLSPIFPMADLTVMGLVEVLPRIPTLLRRIRETAEVVGKLKPAALVTIDSPDFSFRVAKRVKPLGVPRIHYVAPSVWAWKPERAAKIAQFLDHVMALLPFEPPYFEAVGLPCSFVGHPAVEDAMGQGNAAAFRARHTIPPDRRIVVMLPGSRAVEIERLLPIFAEALRLVQAGRPPMTVAVPVVSSIAGRVRVALSATGIETIVVESAGEKRDAFAAADVALAKSGTVTLELALAGVPAIIAYRVNPVSYKLAMRRATVRYVGLPNLVLDRPLMPELLQDECRPARLAAEFSRLLDDSAARQTQIEGGAEIRRRLSIGGTTPSAAAADVVLKTIRT